VRLEKERECIFSLIVVILKSLLLRKDSDVEAAEDEVPLRTVCVVRMVYRYIGGRDVNKLKASAWRKLPLPCWEGGLFLLL